MAAPAVVQSVDLKKLKAHFLTTAPTCVHQAEGMLLYPYAVPTYDVTPGADDRAKVPERSLTGHYLQMYDWDSCFFSQVSGRFGFPDLSRSVVANFLSLKHADGYVPRTVSPEKVWDSGDLCKPFLCQTLQRWWKSSPTKPVPAEFILDLDCYFKYAIRTRRHASGLFHWRNVLESGVDDNLTLLRPMEAAVDENKDIGRFPDGELLAADYNGYMVAEFSSFSEICNAAGKKELALEYQTLAQQLKQLIEDRLWDDLTSSYCNLDPKENKLVQLRCWTNTVPALLGIARPDRTEKVIENNLLNEKEFFRPCGLSSVSASETLYNQAMRGLYGRVVVSNWQGPMWILPNALAVRCLLREKRENDAREISRRVAATVLNGIEKTGTTFENYDAETGHPLWAPQFMSWNALILEMIDLLE